MKKVALFISIFPIMVLAGDREIPDLHEEGGLQTQTFLCDDYSSGGYSFHLMGTTSGGLFSVTVSKNTTSTDAWGSPPIRLKQVDTDTGFRFQNEDFVILGIDKVAILNDGIDTVTCRSKLSMLSDRIQALSYNKAGALINHPGLSLGGKIRAGPGMEYMHVQSLAANTPITILQNTGIVMNGYAWFRFEATGGIQGYQWGGLMCSDGKLLKGIYQLCKKTHNTK